MPFEWDLVTVAGQLSIESGVNRTASGHNSPPARPSLDHPRGPRRGGPLPCPCLGRPDATWGERRPSDGRRPGQCTTLLMPQRPVWQPEANFCPNFGLPRPGRPAAEGEPGGGNRVHCGVRERSTRRRGAQVPQGPERHGGEQPEALRRREEDPTWQEDLEGRPSTEGSDTSPTENSRPS
jgi:hypothetical protein